MLIALDARTIYRAGRRGTGKNLIDLYAHLREVRPDWRVVAYHRAQGDADELLPAPARDALAEVVTPRRIEIPGDRFDAWQRLRLPMAAWRDGADVLHCPANECPAWLPMPALVTIHDLIPLDASLPTSFDQRQRFESSVRTACAKAAHIMCPSAYTRDQLVRRFGVSTQCITVNAWAADSAVRRVDSSVVDETLSRYGVARPYVLHMGAGEARKNTHRLIEAWATTVFARQNSCQLLVIGLDDQTRALATTLAERLNVSATVRLHGFADERDMSTLLSAAELVAYPSLSEGFGLPILDAWAAGTAVLTSNCTSLPEVAADAAVLIDPWDIASIARGLSQVLRDGRWRQELVRRGAERLKKYSWRATAERFAAAVERAMDVKVMRRAA